VIASLAARVLSLVLSLHSPTLALIEDDPSDDAFLGEHDGPAPWWEEFGEIGHADPDAPVVVAPPRVKAPPVRKVHVPEVCEDDRGDECTDGVDEAGDDCECS